MGCLYAAFFALIYARAILWGRRALNCGRILASHNYWIIWIYIHPYRYIFIYTLCRLIYCECLQRVEPSSRAGRRELFLVTSSINTCNAPLRFLCGFPRPKLGPEQSTLICFKLTRLDSTWKTECFVNIFPKTCQWSVQPIVAATAPRLTCRFVCHVCLSRYSSFCLRPFITFHFQFVSFSICVSISFGGGTDETQIDLLRCLAVSCVSLSLSVSVPPRDFIGITPWLSSGAVAIVASIGRWGSIERTG